MPGPSDQGPSTPDVASARHALASKLVELNEVVERVRSITGTASTEDKSVTAVVRPGGVLVDLRLLADATMMEPAELARTIMATYAAASASAEAQVSEAFQAQTLLPPDFADQLRSGKVDLRAAIGSMGGEQSIVDAERIAGTRLL